MLKVFLVEDEFVVRDGIKNAIDWEGEGFRFCGEAADGELAYPLIQDEKPDIIITDIRMPFMNGLELSRVISKELPQSKIVILSGYEEFSYAKEAIKIGVTEYLLKPINGAELIKTLKRVGEQIKEERTETENIQRYKREMAENEAEIRQRLFNDMIAASLPIAEILERARESGIELSAKQYQIVLFKCDIKGDAETYSQVLTSLDSEIDNMKCLNDGVILIERGIEGKAFIIKGDSQNQIKSLLGKLSDELRDILKRYPQVHYFGGIGDEVHRLTHLAKSFRSASKALSQRFIIEKSDIIRCEEVSAKVLAEDTQELGILGLGNLDFGKAASFLRSGDSTEVPFFIEEFLKGVGKESKKSLLFKQYIIMNMYSVVIRFLKEIGEEQALTEEPFIAADVMKDMFTDLESAKAYIELILTAAIKKRDSIRTSQCHRAVVQAKEFINSNYYDDSISLNQIAAHVNISPSHFSSVFSRETGKSFIKYLTDLRMKKAKELLKCSDMLCADISAEVGYKDPHYFSYLFKKTQNCSPMQYRGLKE